ncbi:mycofactocin biosynthesis FMN-dependent deaminase MftD [Kineosporia sp. J2-2]|uniref:Mycofactocin biosynthesis FMN-dependent deaminase MftD n=1 Tax=Kineosporia corallincola TaxID=2835133 RepID=A0ABS5TN15_9ACTN|nr:pre-mycofactocin synthase MftD [Kineosporia corallincola]MBT0772490.1 mycofactocin biosynthesis FMN-dependent deaminase MftD [Kineosporia corallincola]
MGPFRPWARNPWFESVAQARRRAEKRLPEPVFKALVAGSERGLTPSDNENAFGEIGFAPHVADLPRERRLGVRVMGQNLALPVLISPTGVQAVHPEGEVAVARAAAARGTAMCLSSFASRPIEEVVGANPVTFFQTSWTGSREHVLAGLDRARAAGAAGLILTLNWSFSEGRDWGSPRVPLRLDLATAVRFAPAVITRPAWLLDWVRAGRLPTLTVPNLAEPGRPVPTFFEAYGTWKNTPPPSWDDVGWLRERWDGPFMIKGITRVDDALRAVDHGATAISVSNHGGNNLDTERAAVRSLPAVADAVGDQVEVLMDGGVRRGSDVVKALALGARAVMIGRAPLWGLAANGQAGVENVLDVLRGGIDSALTGLGVASVADLSPADLVVPPGFRERR